MVKCTKHIKIIKGKDTGIYGSHRPELKGFYIETLNVPINGRLRGVGSLLVNMFIDKAFSMEGVESVTLTPYSLELSQVALVGFYNRLGFISTCKDDLESLMIINKDTYYDLKSKGGGLHG